MQATDHDRSRPAAEYVLPLRRLPQADTDASGDLELAELTGYLRDLVAIIDVTVVDGSPPEVFARHRAAWPAAVRQLPVEDWPGRNRKVAGVVTGVRAARHERVIIADDDVRYERTQLAAVLRRLDDGADLVRPQNVFRPQPWHARWDTARTLLNRAFGTDHPGTFGLRRSTFLAMGGYDGDVLFENLELSRTLRAHGGIEVRTPDLFVARRPPSAGHFRGQRVRQAYDSLAQPGRLAAEAALLPALAIVVITGTRRGGAGRVLRDLLALAGLATAVAELGRRRHGGAQAFPRTAALWAPAWLVERAVCTWLALGARLRGGVRYSDGRIRTAAHSLADLRDRRDASSAIRGAEPRGSVGAVAERRQPGPAASAQRERPSPAG